MEQCNSDCGTEEQLWWNSGIMMVEQWKRYGETVIVEQWNGNGGTKEQ